MARKVSYTATSSQAANDAQGHRSGTDLELSISEFPLIEGGVFQKRDAKGDKWINDGSVIDLSGKSANCACDVSVATCK